MKSYDDANPASLGNHQKRYLFCFKNILQTRNKQTCVIPVSATYPLTSDICMIPTRNSEGPTSKSYQNEWFAQWFAHANSSATLTGNAYKTCRLRSFLRHGMRTSQDFIKTLAFLL